MAQNYGYQTTAYGAQGGNEGGGFTHSQSGSQAGAGGDKTYGKDTLRPVTIKQIIDATQSHPDADFKVDGVEITQITFVGQIRSISSQTTNITYKVDDGTGLIEVKQWVDSDAPTNDGQAALVENAYVRVWGRLKSFSQKRHVGSHVLRPVEDMNEISMHLLEATYVHLYFTKGPPDSLQKNGGGDNDSMFVGQGHGQHQQNGGGGMGGPDMSKMSMTARKVFKLLQDSPQNNEGLHVQHISQQLQLPANDVFKAGDELLQSGTIYTTVDDETWAVLEY